MTTRTRGQRLAEAAAGDRLAWSKTRRADAFKGLGKLAAFAPDLVLTDLKMPGMDGLELLRKIHGGGNDLAVIVTTAFADVETAVTALKEGAATT